MRTKLLLLTLSWSLMEMPRPPGMTTLPVLVSSSVSISLDLENWLVVTLSHIFLRNPVLLNNRQLRGLTISSTSFFSPMVMELVVVCEQFVILARISMTISMCPVVRLRLNPLMIMRSWSTLRMPSMYLDLLSKTSLTATCSLLVSCPLEELNSKPKAVMTRLNVRLPDLTHSLARQLLSVGLMLMP